MMIGEENVDGRYISKIYIEDNTERDLEKVGSVNGRR
jgi:hypothetical protein